MSTKDLTTETAQQALSRRRFLTGTAALVAGGTLLAAPGVAKAHETTDPPSDIDILNFALTFEHLEYAFYRDGLKVFNAKDIKSSKFLRGDGKKFLCRQAYRYLQLSYATTRTLTWTR